MNENGNGSDERADTTNAVEERDLQTIKGTFRAAKRPPRPRQRPQRTSSHERWNEAENNEAINAIEYGEMDIIERKVDRVHIILCDLSKSIRR